MTGRRDLADTQGLLPLRSAENRCQLGEVGHHRVRRVPVVAERAPAPVDEYGAHAGSLGPDAVERVVFLAAQRRNDQDLAAIDEALDMMAAEVAGGEHGYARDRTFHAAVTSAARNPILAGMMDLLAEPIEESRRESLSQPGRPPVSLASHRGIARAIRDGDPAGAARAARADEVSHPVGPRGDGHALANTQGIRQVAFAVDDIGAVVASLQARGAELVGEVER